MASRFQPKSISPQIYLLLLLCKTIFKQFAEITHQRPRKRRQNQRWPRCGRGHPCFSWPWCRQPSRWGQCRRSRRWWSRARRRPAKPRSGSFSLDWPQPEAEAKKSCHSWCFLTGYFIFSAGVITSLFGVTKEKLWVPHRLHMQIAHWVELDPFMSLKIKSWLDLWCLQRRKYISGYKTKMEKVDPHCPSNRA